MMIKKAFIVLLAILAISIALLMAQLERKMSQPVSIATPEFLTIKSSTSFEQLTHDMIANGWIDNRFWLRSYVRLHPTMAKIKVGTYRILPQSSVKDILQQLVTGKEYQFGITFIEGTTFRQWLSLLETQPFLTKTLAGKSLSDIASLLNITEQNPEGWFFPDTYTYTAGTSDVVLLQRAHQKMLLLLQQLWETRPADLPFTTPYQALILASIIEKETSQLDEQPLIASVFVNRLTKNMRLQTDPTVIYGLGARYQGDIKRIHLREKTAYNTYQIKGLPPTPIAMPGLSALKASVSPADSNYLYFVSQGNGHHVFSSNIADHNAAVAQYQLGKNK